MTKVGRNDPCPCGSGRKHKRCCLPSHSLAAPAATPAVGRPQRDDFDDGGEDLDELSNGVSKEIKAGRLDEAERLCKELDRRYPDLIDPLHRYAMLYEARGELATAALYYRRAAQYALSHAGFDTGLVAAFVGDAERLEATLSDPAAPPKNSYLGAG